MEARFTKHLFKLVALACLCMSACESFLDVEPPNSMVPADVVFADDATATAAMAGMYLDMLFQNHFASGSSNGIVSVAGLSADELIGMKGDPKQTQVESNNLDAENLYTANVWTSGYKTIYQANAVLDGLAKSTGVTLATKQHCSGEALFIRAFCHFYLMNSFGDIPIITTTNYKVNAGVIRQPVDDVYDQIIMDLQEAESLLSENYITTGRVRPNKFAATALLARVYLYREDWQRAEDKSGNVISENALYNVDLTPLNNVFLSNSKEAIWQIKVQDGGKYTNEGYNFGTVFGHTTNVLDSSILDVFEPGDLRRTNWVTSKVISGARLYYPYKYKLQNAAAPNESNEYSTVLRLAEQHLIRAEARAKQDKLALAIADLDVVRKRAGLPLIQVTNPGITKDALLLAIEQERRIELLAEWGHRWFDLKRTDRANTVLTYKPGWSTNDQLYPLPAVEMRSNPKLKPQNPGY